MNTPSRSYRFGVVPPQIQKPLSAVIKGPATDANGAKSHSENSSRQKRSFTVTRPNLARRSQSLVDPLSYLIYRRLGRHDSKIFPAPSSLRRVSFSQVGQSIGSGI